jgi:hypothetical protein
LGMDVCLLWVLCVVRSLRRADHSSRGVLLSVVCLMCVIVKPRKKWGDLGPQGAVEPLKKSIELVWLIKICLNKTYSKVLIRKHVCDTIIISKTLRLSTRGAYLGNSLFELLTRYYED